MTISLCMIVKNEEKTLARCLESVKDIIDEIIIVDTGSSDKTKTIAFEYTDKVFDFEWIDDFSAARNFAFSKGTMEYLMWLDADDVILESDRIKFKELKNSLDSSFDVIMMRYNMCSAESEFSACTFMRERILKRERNFLWNDPIHEFILFDGKILNSDVCITHKKMHGRFDRNLKIFEKMIEENKIFTDRNNFYFARELFLNKQYDKAIVYYDRFLETSGGLTSNYTDACIDLANCYRQKNDDRNVLKSLLRSFEHDTPRGEICCNIAFYYKQKQDYAKAIFWFELASRLKKPVNMWGSFLPDFYDFIPFMELASCYYYFGNINRAIEYNNKAGELKPDNNMVRQNNDFFNKIKSNSLSDNFLTDA